MYKVWLFLFFSLIQHGVDAILTPSGPTVSVDCEGQQTFTCSVTGTTAQWTITGLDGITASGDSGFRIASNNIRVTTTDISGAVPTSTITITGFTTADDGGTIQCINQEDDAVQGMTTVSLGVPSCPTNVQVTDRRSDFSSATITWDQPTNSPPVTSYDVTCNSSCTAVLCTSGSSTCRVVSVRSCEDYSVTVLPMNSCGSNTGCTIGNSVAVPLQANCSIPSETPPPPGCPLCWLLLLLLPLLILVGYSITVALMWHLYYKDYNYCQVYWCCCFCKPREGDGKIRTSSTEPMKTSPPSPPAPVVAAPLGEYADPKDVRKRKEENKIQYADLEFTKQSGGGRGTIHQKEEPVTYTAIQHA